MTISKTPFGTTKAGKPVHLYTLTNANGTEARILDYGATIQSLIYQGEDRVLGYDDLEGYENGDAYIGAVIGRVGNRIGEAQFELDGKTYSLFANNGLHCNHGGKEGFDRKVWTAGTDGRRLILDYLSPDGEEGFPGNLKVRATYELTEDDALILKLSAETDAPTPVNLTCHPYFNLSGEDTVKNHDLQVYSDLITNCDETLLPDGAIVDIQHSSLDFTKKKKIGEALSDTHSRRIREARGIDHNYILSDDFQNRIQNAATLSSGPVSLTVLTDQPGVQIYTANWLDDIGKGGRRMGNYSGCAIEGQGWPDSIHHASFPNCVLEPGEPYNRTIIYQFENESSQSD